MKATIKVKNALGDVIALIDGKNLRSAQKGFVEVYIPKDETTAPMMNGLTKLALSGGTVTFEPNYKRIASGDCVYMALRPEFVEIEWED